LTAGIAAAVRADGFPLACYTINRRDEAERLFAMGVSAVFSDRPDLWAPAEM
jgi:glycerophosphoryl diester phosphodiesterase